MLAIRDTHAHGATRVSISSTYILTGGADGVVSLYATKQWPKGSALWSFQCHEDAVTDVVLADALGLALSCGRDGRILLHESILEATKPASRVICQVTGEVRCLQLDVERRRVFIAGDSLRCLDMAHDRFRIHTIPLVVPHPIVSLAVSPCGQFIAMASASGELGVVSVGLPSSTEAANTVLHAQGTSAVSPPPTPAPPAKVQFVFRSVLSPTAKKEDTARYRMSWCRTKVGGLMLMVPTMAEVQVYQLEEANTTAPAARRMRAVGGLHDRQQTDLHGALVYNVTQNRLACIMVSRDGLFVGKVEGKTLAMSRHTSEMYLAHAANAENAAAVTDVQVNPQTGDVAVGLANGRVSLLRRAAPRVYQPPSGARAGATAVQDVDAEESTADGDVEQGNGEPKGATKTSTATKARASKEKSEQQRERAASSRHSNHKRPSKDDLDEDFNDDSSDEDSASASSADDSFSASDASSASSDDGASEDFKTVVTDLEKNGSSRHDNDGERPSRWRRSDTAAALVHAKREAERQHTRSRFLDDEAEEGSTEEDEEEGVADHVQSRERGYGSRPPDAEDVYEDDASLEGQAEDEGEDGVLGSSGAAGAHQLNASSPSSTARVHGGARTLAVQDYSFQVGATPAGAEGSCYLAYNSVGYIHCSREATTVHFHDISYPAVRVQLRDTILMGALSPVGAGFVVVPTEPSDAQASVDETPRLTVMFHAFTPLGAQSEWRVSLLPGETVRCMAAGIRYLAVATSHYLRIFSLSGLELAVLSKCHRIVTMVGTSSRKLMSSFKADFDPLAIVTLTGTGELQMEVMDVGARTVALPARTMPLTELPDGSTHQLQWLGWSEDGSLHTADTAGVVRLFTEDWGGSWVPVYDPRTLVDQSFALWVYGVNENALLAYRYSRDDPSYPAAAASGLSTELVPLFLPLTRTMSEEGLERWDKLLRQQLRSDELKRHGTYYNAAIAKYDEVHDHHLLQFFEAALKGQQTTRALELAMLLEIHDRVVKCAQVANTNGYAKLVPKLLALYEMRMTTKNKRKCTLPLKETLVSDRKKDELLRKLLGQMTSQDKKRGDNNNPSGESTSNGAVPSSPELGQATVSPQAESAKVSPSRASISSTASPVNLAPVATSPSAASTATTATTATAMDAETSSGPSGAGASARRHITFAREVASPPLGLSQVSTTTTATTAATSSAPTVPRKMSNPFAKPTPAAAAVPVRVPATREAEQPSPALSFAKAVPSTPHQTRFTMTSSASKAAAQTTLLGSSQMSTPPRATANAAGSAVASPSGKAREEAEAATSESPVTGSTPEGHRVSAGHTNTSPMHAVPPPLDDKRASSSSANEHRSPQFTPSKAEKASATTSSFIPRELPASTAHTGNGSGPVDPFLEAEGAMNHQNSGGGGKANGCASDFHFLAGGLSFSNRGGSHIANADDRPSVSVQSLLDAGHSETAPVVRSDSFGEALRKRYRDDDEDMEEEDAPVAVVPKLTI